MIYVTLYFMNRQYILTFLSVFVSFFIRYMSILFKKDVTMEKIE